MTPQRLFRTLAIAEAITWALLLFGMFLKYGPEVTELGVRIFGMVHGVVFIGYCLVTVLVAVDRRWSPGRTLLGLVAAIPPFATLLFDTYAQRSGLLAGDWRLPVESGSGLDRPTSWLLRNPGRGAVVGLGAVAALTGIALLVGPPA